MFHLQCKGTITVTSLETFGGGRGQFRHIHELQVEGQLAAAAAGFSHQIVNKAIQLSHLLLNDVEIAANHLAEAVD
jgi:hypothetical protein